MKSYQVNRNIKPEIKRATLFFFFFFFNLRDPLYVVAKVVMYQPQTSVFKYRRNPQGLSFLKEPDLSDLDIQSNTIILCTNLQPFYFNFPLCQTNTNYMCNAKHNIPHPPPDPIFFYHFGKQRLSLINVLTLGSIRIRRQYFSWGWAEEKGTHRYKQQSIG